MPKTGTTSIQDSLYFGLRDPAFDYLRLGHPNHSFIFAPLFKSHPESFWVFQMRKYSKARIGLLKRMTTWRLRRALGQLRKKSKTPILSAESCWSMPPSELERLRDFFSEEGFEVRVIAYIRPIRSWIQSLYQQRIKWRKIPFEPVRLVPPDETPLPFQCARRLGILENIFGSRNVTVRPFPPPAPAGGCSVMDFCKTLGIAFDPKAVIRSNDSLCADAVRFLFAYHRFPSAQSAPTFGERVLLNWHLRELKGPPLRLDASLFEPVADLIDAETRAVRDRYGIDLSEDFPSGDEHTAMREESDMFRYSRESLDWLAGVSRSAPIEGCEGPEVARRVADRMDRLRRRPSRKIRNRMLADKARTLLRSMLHAA